MSPTGDRGRIVNLKIMHVPARLRRRRAIEQAAPEPDAPAPADVLEDDDQDEHDIGETGT